MADTIGRASLILSTNAEPMNQGLKQAQGTMSSFGQSALALLTNPAVIAIAAIATAVISLKAAFGTASSYLDTMKAKVIEIAGNAKLAERFDLAGGFERFQELQAVVKQDAEDLAGTLSTFATSLSMAEAGSKKQERIFRQLGLDARELSGLPLDEQFQRVGERVAGLGSATDRIRIATQLFGSADVLDGLQSGFQGSIDRARELGGVVSNEDAAAARKANSAFKEMNRIIGFLWTQAGAAIANSLAMWNQGMRGMVELAAPAFRMVIDIIRAVSNVIERIGRTLAESFDASPIRDFFATTVIDIPATEEAVLTFVQGAAEGVGWFIDMVIKGSADFGDYFVVPLLRGLGSLWEGFSGFLGDFDRGFIQPFIDRMQRLLGIAGSLARLDPTGATQRLVDGARSALDAARELPGQIANAYGEAGSSANAIADSLVPVHETMRNMANVEGAVEDFFERARRRSRNAPPINPAQLGINPRLEELAARLQEQYQNPIEKYNREIEDLQRLLAEGLIDPETFGQAVEHALGQAEQALNVAPVKFAGAALAGSKEAMTEIYHRGFERSNDPAERMQRLAERANQLQERNVRNGEQLLQLAIDNGGLQFGVI